MVETSAGRMVIGQIHVRSLWSSTKRRAVRGDRICWGRGKDTIQGGNQGDVLLGGGDRVRVSGNPGFDILDGV